ncbi:MAG: hypothetical protein M5R42_21585 [Rhodocyclaceae bacterium]|nr:hypothetical protein [Rhodocyclaceae bacterium]
MERQARRETLLRLAAAGALGAGGILGLVREALSAGSLPATPGFRHIKGPVGVDATRASIGLNIKPGQSVMTGVGGEAVYIVGPDAFLQREKTKITFEESGARSSCGSLRAASSASSARGGTVSATCRSSPPPPPSASAAPAATSRPRRRAPTSA